MAKFSLFCALILSSALNALPIGNPAEPVLLSQAGQMTMRLGYCNETVGTTPLVAENWTQNAKWMNNSAQLTVNALGKIDAFVTLGVANLRTKPEDLLSSLPKSGNANACLSIRTFPAASYGYGIRVALIKFAGLYLGAESQVLQSNPRPFFSTTKSQNKYAEEGSLHFKQEQIGLAASYTIPMGALFTPYAGVRWQRIQLNFRDLAPPESLGGALVDLTEKSPWGGVVGAALIGKQRWSVSSEANVWTERSFSLIAQLRY